jgi:hypothetical protein
MQRLTWFKIVLLAAALALVCGCSSLRFRKVSVLGAVTDPRSQSTRVSIAFEVWNGNEQLTKLSAQAFAVYEDGRAAPNEALKEARTSERRMPVVLLLDTGAGLHRSGAVAELKRAASRFVSQLTGDGFHVTTYRFATQIDPVSDISAIAESFDAGGSSSTSLYAAIGGAFAKHPDAIVVAFSAAADDHSQNHRVAGLSVVEDKVLPEDLGGTGDERVLHAVGFGSVAQERDRQGVPGKQALERLARNGSYAFARDKSALDAAFADVAQRIQRLRIYDYYSSHVGGRHDLVIEVRAQGQVAETESLRFVAGGTALRAKFTPPGGLVWNGPAAAVQDAVTTADRCTQATSESLADEACAALVVIAESSQDVESVEAVRAFLKGSVCQRFAVSACPLGPARPSGE